MASRRLAVSLAYPRREVSARGATRLDLRSLILLVGLLALAAFAGVLYLSQASTAAALRYRLGEVEGEARDLTEQNLILRQEIADLGRLSTVEERAARLGMVDGPAPALYVACATPKGDLATAKGPAQPSAAGGNQGTDRDLWQEIVSWVGLVPRPGPNQLAALNAEHP